MLRAFDPNTYWTTRLDHRFTDKHSVFGRYTWNRSHTRDFDNALPPIGQRWQTRDTRAIQVSYTAMLRMNLVNEFRWGFAWNDNPRHGPFIGNEIVRELGLTGLVPGLRDVNGVPQISFSGLGITTITQTQWRHPGFMNFAQQFQEHVSWFHGRHNFKAGVIPRRHSFRTGKCRRICSAISAFQSALQVIPTPTSSSAIPLRARGLTQPCRWTVRAGTGISS